MADNLDTVLDLSEDPPASRLDPSSAPESTSTAARNKRKREPDADKKSKRSNKKINRNKADHSEEVEIDLVEGINTAFSRMDSQLLADYIAQSTRKFESDLSSVEYEDKYIPGMSSFNIWLHMC